MMKKKQFWAWFFLIAAMITAGLIFWFSSQKRAVSLELSDSIALRLAGFFRPGYKEMNRKARRSYLLTLRTIIRKNAHFCEFMLLGFNLMGHMRFRNAEMNGHSCRLWAWGIATAYAASDELHQLFVNARTARLSDILLDSAGSLVGILVMTLGLALHVRIVQKRLGSRRRNASG